MIPQQRLDDSKRYVIVSLALLPLVVYAALIMGMMIESGRNGIDTIVLWAERLSAPGKIAWTPHSAKAILVFLLIYIFFVMYAYMFRKNIRDRTEHGSAKWGEVKAICKEIKDPDENNNMILSQGLLMSNNDRFHRLNLNVLVIGGPGTGKTFYYVKPNLLQMNCSYFVIDPDGECLRDTAEALKANGYTVKVINLLEPMQSNRYNPFSYLESELDVQRLVTNLFNAVVPTEQQANASDPFWNQAAEMLLKSIFYYIYLELPKSEQDFNTVMDLFSAAAQQDKEISVYEQLMIELEMKNPKHIAIEYYQYYAIAPVKTRNSVYVTLASKLEKMLLADMKYLFSGEELHFDRLGDEKMAIFAVIPEDDTSLNFVISMLYLQMFQKLSHRNRLPRHVKVIMDEFANVHVPEDFLRILTSVRKRNISIDIIVQAMAQLQNRYEKGWETICGACSTIIYLGGQESTSHEYISKLLGKETIDTISYQKGHGRSSNYQRVGRELMAPDEIRGLDSRYGIYLISGKKPLIDNKYNCLKHPNIGLTPFKGGKPFLNLRTDGLKEIIPKGTNPFTKLKGKEIINSDQIIQSESK